MLNGIITPLSAQPLWLFVHFCCTLQNAFYLGWQFEEPKNKGGLKRLGYKVWVWSEVLEHLHYYQGIKHHILWSGVIWGNSQVRSWRLQRMAGVKVIGLWMGAQSSQEIPNRGGFMPLKNPQKYLVMPKCFWCHWAAFGSSGHQTDSVDLITAFPMHCVMGYRELKGDKRECEMCFCRNNRSFPGAVCWLFVALLHQFYSRIVGTL